MKHHERKDEQSQKPLDFPTWLQDYMDHLQQICSPHPSVPVPASATLRPSSSK
jgi:hypothetical protein